MKTNSLVPGGAWSLFWITTAETTLFCSVSCGFRLQKLQFDLDFQKITGVIIYPLDQYQPCLHSFKCILHATSKYDDKMMFVIICVLYLWFLCNFIFYVIILWFVDVICFSKIKQNIEI